MAATRIQFKPNPGVANGDSISSAFDGNVVAGNKILVRVGSYQTAEITAGMCTDSQGNTYTLHSVETRAGDGFSCAILSATAASSAACTVTVDVTGNNYYALYIEEWEGLGDAVDSANAEGSSSAPSTGTNALSAGVDGYAFAFMTHASATTTIAVGSGWTEDAELQSNDTTLTYSAMSRATTASTTYTADWALGASCSWIAVSAIFQVAPETWEDNISLDNTSDGDIASSFTPAIDGTFIITATAWKPSEGINPTAAMLSSNNGGTFVLDDIVDCTEGRAEASINTPGLAGFRHRVVSIDNLPYTISVDANAGGAGGTYGSWSAQYFPDIIETDPLDDSDGDVTPPPSTGVNPTQIDCGTVTPTTTSSRVVIAAHNGGHADTVTVETPAGATRGQDQAENSALLSGHSARIDLTTGDAYSPFWPLDQPSSGAGTAGYVRGLVLVYKREGGTPISANLSAGANGVTVTAPSATIVPGTSTISAGAIGITVTAPAAVVGGAASTLGAGANGIAVTAPAATIVPGTVTLSAGVNGISVVVPLATVQGVDQFVAAGANGVTVFAPVATLIASSAPDPPMLRRGGGILGAGGRGATITPGSVRRAM